MLGFDPHLPIAPTGEFPGFVNPMDPVGGSDLVVIGVDEDITESGNSEAVDDESRPSGPRRGRRPAPPVQG
jgi:hypothetical protein